MTDVKENYSDVIKPVIYEDAEKSTFEARQKYYELFCNQEKDEFPCFFQLQQTGISLEPPKEFAFGIEHFIDHMTKKGWSFNIKKVTDFELSDTYMARQPSGIEYGHRQWDIDVSKYQSNINLPCLLEKMYFKNGFITKDGQPVSLYNGCKYANDCWNGIDDRKPIDNNVKWSYASFPWIGENYFKNKILVLGINTNEGGGFDYNTQIITEAREELKCGRKRVNFGYIFPNGKSYAGTFLWHRIACYTKAVEEALACNSEDVFDEIDRMDRLKNIENVQAEYDNNSFLNHIKCSPIGDRSKPSAAMWKNCGSHILARELKILSPEYLVVLGAGDNIYYLKNNVLEGDISNINVTSEVKLYYTRHFGKPLKIIAVPHPSSSIKEDLILKVFESALQGKHIYVKKEMQNDSL